MPRKPKAGPPYTDIPDEVYVVVAHPWGMRTRPRERGQSDFDHVASWAQLVLGQGGLGGGRAATIECMYSMGTRDEIIIQFEEGTDVIPLLGEHRWAAIARDWTGSPDDDRATRVFLYNWKDNGDPANHNWTENFPRCITPNDVPAKSPYPVPSWTAPPTSLANFVLPIPRPQFPSPVLDRADAPVPEMQLPTLPLSAVAPSPPQEQDQEDQPAQAEASVVANVFRPYAPPPYLPFRGRFPAQSQAQDREAPSLQASPPLSKFVKKLDPYELEEDALSILRAPDPVQEGTKVVKPEEFVPTLSLSIKAEPWEIKVKAEPNEDGQSLSMHPLPPASLGYQPAPELAAYIAAHLQGVAAARPSSSSGSTRVAVKREYEEDAAASLGKSKHVKVKMEDV